MLARRFAAWLLAALLCLLPRPALAAMMRHHDLASLALESSAIVRARRLGPLSGDDRVARLEIVAVYAGSLDVGETVDVALAAYGPESFARADEVIVFIRAPSRREGPARWPVASGVRLVDGGRVLRFVQFDNPGLYGPVPQGRDPYDVMHDPRGGGEAVALAEFEEDLARAIARAGKVPRLLEDLKSPAGRRRALAWIGPPPGTEDERPVVAGEFEFFEDLVGTAILEALARTGDVTLLLDGVARLRGGVDLFMLRHEFSADDLLAVAVDREQPGPRRAAATAMIGHRLAALDKPDTLAGLVRLLADPDAGVRRAAAEVVGERELKHPSLRAAVVEQFARETDAGVRLALGGAGRANDVLRELRAAEGGPIVAAERRGRALVVRWSAWSNWSPDAIALLVAEDGATRRVALEQGARRSSSGTVTELVHPLALDPTDPRIELAIEVRFDRRGDPRSFRIPLPRRAPVPREDQPSDPPAIAASPAKVEPAATPGREPAATPRPVGCACDGRGGARGGPLVVVLLLARRRRRTCLEGHVY